MARSRRAGNGATIDAESTVDEGTVATIEAPVNSDAESTPDSEQKGYAEYKLAGDVPPELKGRTIKTPEKYTIEAFRALVQDGDDKHTVSLAQAQFDIIIQRHIRNASNSEDVAKLLKEDDVEGAVALIQKVADSYVYGARPLSTGESTTNRRNKENMSKLREGAAADPELAKRLADLGVSL